MERIGMSKEILNIINVVLDYKKFLSSYHYKMLKDMDFDVIEKAEEFYYSLDLPNGMNKNKIDFETILSYGISGHINKLNLLQVNELKKENWKNY